MRTSLLLLLVALLLSAVPAASQKERRVLPPRAQDAISDFASHLQVGMPRRYQNLTLYPIFAEDVEVADIDLTLDAAMAKGWIEVRELKSTEVNRVRVSNTGKRPVFIMGGEMLGGAKQDRIVGDDLIIPARSEIVIPVFCVEHGRWAMATDRFVTTGFIAPSEVRKARARGDQAAVWTEVAGAQERLAAPSTTGTLQSVTRSHAVQEKAKPYTRALEDLPVDMPKAQGVVAAVGDEIIAADLFSSTALFRKLWPKLLDSYVVDAVDRSDKGRAPDAVAVKRWLSGIPRAARTENDTPGEGRLFELRGGGVIGSALVSGRAVVHMELFKGLSTPETDYNPLHFRRDRLESR
jgi:hypothetical protein